MLLSFLLHFTQDSRYVMKEAVFCRQIPNVLQLSLNCFLFYIIHSLRHDGRTVHIATWLECSTSRSVGEYNRTVPSQLYLSRQIPSSRQKYFILEFRQGLIKRKQNCEEMPWIDKSITLVVSRGKCTHGIKRENST